ncbi:general substrate transporter [Exidia glandulosa HHB12029]|uniref:General substrate transporter n=1 Tax=Exidia glandulosa HHB12029 TaxID=1314781 RepID=A0A165PZD3_EXIGL|nr:general substrate transporter [Exidia glandulosa HHB12029]
MLYSGRWYQHSHLVVLNLVLVIPLISSYANGYDGSMMNGLQSVDQWRTFFDNPGGSRLGLLNAIQSIGSLCGTLPAPYVADIFGRRIGIITGSFIVLGGSILQAATQNINMFIASRFLIGFGTTFAQMASPLLISELAYVTQRAPLTSLYNSLWSSGNIIAAWTTFGTFRIASNWSWRIPSALQGLSSVIQVFTIWFVPESPRWLCSKGRHAEARKILAKYHAAGDETHPLIAYEMREITDAIALEAEMAKVSWLDLFRTPGNRRRMRVIIAIALFSQLSGNTLTSYYLSRVLNSIGITSAADQTLINGVLAIYSFAVAAAASLCVEKAGRRPLFLVSTAGMAVAFSCLTACAAVFQTTGNKDAAHGVVAFIFVGATFYPLAYTPLLVSYTVELVPFFLRAKGLAVMNLAVLIAIIFGQYINPIALQAIQWKYYLVYAIWIFVEFGCVYMWVVETKGRSLEETAVLFDGEDAARELAERAHAEAVGEARGDDVDEKKGSEIIMQEHVMPTNV